MSPDLRPRLDLALTIAQEAGRITLEYFQRDDLEVDRKADDSPVTVADRRAEEHLRGRIAECFPADAILGEEFPDRAGTSGYRWILDPIDGTKAFIHGVPLYGTMVGVECDGQTLAGVVTIPALEECVYAGIGLGAWYVSKGQPPRPARVSRRAPLSQGLFLTSEVANFDSVGRRDAYDRLQQASRLSRTWGDCYAYMLVAIGRAEVAVDPIMNPWDAAAVLPIIVEAGGQFTDWTGQRSIYSGQGVATNGLVHDEVLAILRSPGAA